MKKKEKREKKCKISVSDFALGFSAFTWIVILIIELLIK